MNHIPEKDAPRRCQKKGHKWRQKNWGVHGLDACARRGCTAESVTLGDPPWSIPPEEQDV